MRDRIGIAIDQVPFTPRLCRRHVATGRTVHARGQRLQRFVGDGQARPPLAAPFIGTTGDGVLHADARLAKAETRFYTAGMTLRAILDETAGRLRPSCARARMRGFQARISISRIG